MLARLTDDQSALAGRWFGYALRVAGDFSARTPRLAHDFESAAALAVVALAGKHGPARFRDLLPVAAKRACLSVYRADRPKGYRSPPYPPPPRVVPLEIRHHPHWTA